MRAVGSKNKNEIDVEGWKFKTDESTKGKLFAVPRSIQQRKAKLKRYIALRMDERWFKMSKQMAAFERRYLDELIESINPNNVF